MTITDPLIDRYVQRALKHGAARRGVDAYRYGLECLLRSARRATGFRLDLVDVIKDESLLGHALVDDRAFVTDTTLSRWTLAQRRSAVRSFATLMYPELYALISRDPHQAIDNALRSVAERVGTGYRLTGGAPRRRGGDTPSAELIARVLEVAGNTGGLSGVRNLAFFGILAATGARVTALQQLSYADCIVMPSGRIRLRLHEKGKSQAREVELPGLQAATLLRYVERFNAVATERGLTVRIDAGVPGSLWRNESGDVWSTAAIRSALAGACAGAGAPRMTPHAFRRAYATDAASLLPRHVVALAGGWQGVARLDDSYVHPRTSVIWEKLSRTCTTGLESERRPTADVPAVVPA